MGLRTKVRTAINKKWRYPMQTYRPKNLRTPQNLIQITSAWVGLEQVIEDILERFDIQRDRCIEFGTEFCYSTVALSNYFKQVIGVDLFTGDEHSGYKEDHYEKTSKSVAPFDNIELIQSDYRDYIKQDDTQYDFAHVDIIHTYEGTYECGLWAVEHSKCCVFHDTESFVEVRQAVFDLAKHTGKRLYNYPRHHGLGIIV